VFVGGAENLLIYGAGIVLPIAALGLFIGLRARATKLTKESPKETDSWKSFEERGAADQEAA
jgi:cytochrome c biogenesis protein CcdA